MIEFESAQSRNIFKDYSIRVTQQPGHIYCQKPLTKIVVVTPDVLMKCCYQLHQKRICKSSLFEITYPFLPQSVSQLHNK